MLSDLFVNEIYPAQRSSLFCFVALKCVSFHGISSAPEKAICRIVNEEMMSKMNLHYWRNVDGCFHLTHWGRVTHICVSNLTIIGSDNGLSPARRQAIIWTNARILLTGPMETNFSEILIGIQTFSFKKMYLKMSSAKWRPFFSASMC